MITGSVAALLHGVPLAPRDLDVVPDMARANLLRLFALLADLEASPGAVGHWEGPRGGKRRWIPRPTRRSEIDAWRPVPDDPATFDHLFRTRLGNVDVVWELTGRYERLRRRAVTRRIEGVRVFVAHPSDLLASLRRADRAKDRDRVARLAALAAPRHRRA